MVFLNETCGNFLDYLASKAPVPGGGGAAAYTGALGTALANMVCALTQGKKKFAEFEADLERISRQAYSLRKKLAMLTDKDAEVFEPLSVAYGLPANTPEEAKLKEEKLEAALKLAATVPYETMEACAEAIELHYELAGKCSALVISDVAVGIVLCEAALKSAAVNIYINTKFMKDRENADKLNEAAKKIIIQNMVKTSEIYDRIVAGLIGEGRSK